MIYFGLCSSFTCSGYDLTLIKNVEPFHSIDDIDVEPFHDGGWRRRLSQKKRTRCLWFFSLCFITLHHKSLFG